MAIKELTNKSEQLIELGEKEEQRYNELQSRVDDASISLRQIEISLIKAETLDENGNPSGDVESIRARMIYMQAVLRTLEIEKQATQDRIDRINLEKNGIVNDFEKYHENSQIKLNKVDALKDLRFGENANDLILDIVNRMNKSEEAKAKLLSSMGIINPPKISQANLAAGGSFVGNDNSSSSSTQDSDDGVMVKAKTRNGWNTIKARPDYNQKYNDLASDQAYFLSYAQEKISKIAQSELSKDDKVQKCTIIKQETKEYLKKTEEEKNRLLSLIAQDSGLAYETNHFKNNKNTSKAHNIPDEFTKEELMYYKKLISVEPCISKDISGIAQELGGSLEGFQYRIKQPESLIYKMTHDNKGNLIKYANGRSIEIEKINDILRYTQVYDENRIATATLDSIELLQDKGYRLEKVANTFTDKSSAYKGINMAFRDPEGNKFELQSHTPKSYHIKEFEMHKLYKQMNFFDTESKEYKELEKSQFALTENFEVPVNMEIIQNYRKGQS